MLGFSKSKPLLAGSIVAGFAALAECVLVASAQTATRKPAPGETWWAFVSPVRPPVPTTPRPHVPTTQNPIDAFLLAKLREKGLDFAPEADRRTLIRRAYFDLIGLP